MKNGDMSYKNLWDTTKEILRRKYIAKRPQISNLTIHVMKLGKKKKKRKENLV